MSCRLNMEAAAQQLWNLHAQERGWDELSETEKNQVRFEAVSVVSAAHKNQSDDDEGPLEWTRELDDEDLETFLGELREAIGDSDGDALQNLLNGWRITVRELSDPVRREILTRPILTRPSPGPTELMTVSQSAMAAQYPGYERGVRLYSAALLSKWGFSDGDLLSDAVAGTALEARTSWHAVLCLLVRRHLIPEIEKNSPGHTFQVVEIGTCHNPIRIEMIDAVEIDWRSGSPLFVFEPEFVDVTWEQILTAVQDAT